MTYKQISYDKSKRDIAKLDKTADNLYSLLTNPDIKLSAYEIRMLEEKIIMYTKQFEDAKNNIINVPFKIKRDVDEIFDTVKYLSALFTLTNLNIGFSIFIFAFFLQLGYRNNFVIEKDSDYEHHMNMVHNTLYNCANNFNRIKKNMGEEFQTTKSQIIKDSNTFELEENRYNIANLIINTYLSGDAPLAKLLDYPEEIQNMVVSILQDNLKTNKTSIVTLIVMARESLLKQQVKTMEIQTQNMKKSRFKR